jgi:hypothetical protein
MDPIDQYSMDERVTNPFNKEITYCEKTEMSNIMPSINNKKLCDDVILELEEPDMSLLLSNAHTKKE